MTAQNTRPTEDGQVVAGPWGVPQVLSVRASAKAQLAALQALAHYTSQIEAAARHARLRDRLTIAETAILLGAGNAGPLPAGSTFTFHRKWLLPHWERQGHLLHPCPWGCLLVQVVDGLSWGVVCAYAPMRPPRGKS